MDLGLSSDEVGNPLTGVAVAFEEERDSHSEGGSSRAGAKGGNKKHRAKSFVSRHVHHHSKLHGHTDAVQAHHFNHPEPTSTRPTKGAHLKHHFRKISAAGTHSSLRAVTKAELTKAGVEVEDMDLVLDSPEMAKLREAFGESHVPSLRMLLHLAKSMRKKQTLESKVLPEMIKADAGTSDSPADSHTFGPTSIGQKLFDWTSDDNEIPLWLMAEERNSTARRRIQDTILLDPDCGLRQTWDVAQLCLLLFLAFDLPYKVGFNIEQPPLHSFGFYVVVATDAFFVFDIVLSFITCYYNEEGLLVAENRKLIARYVQGWFFLDLVSVIPLNYFAYLSIWETEIDSWNPQTLKVVKLLRLIKLLRLARLQRLIKKYENHFFVFFNRLKEVNLVLGIFAVGHWVACLWNFVGYTIDDDGNAEGWVAGVLSYRWPNANQSDAVSAAAIPAAELYLLNYFAAIYSLIAGGVPFTTNTATNAEFIFSCIAIVAGGFVYANIVGNITELNRKSNMENDIKASAVARAIATCRTAGADSFLRHRIMEQIRYDIDNSPDPNYITTFLNSMTGDLEMTFAQQLNWVPKMISGMPQFGLLHCIPFMTVLDNRSKILICSKLVFCTFKRFDHTSIRSNESGAGRRITVEGQPGSDMYIVISGRIAVVQDHQVLGYLEKKGFFCENSNPAVATHRQLRPAAAADTLCS